MLYRARPLVASCWLAVVVVVAGAPLIGAAPKSKRLEEWLPDDVIGFAKIRDLGPQVRGWLSSDLRRRLYSSTVGQHLSSQDRFKELESRLESFQSVCFKVQTSTG